MDNLSNLTLNRKIVIKHIVQNLNEHDLLVASLGFISRELYSETASMRERCFYCLGSMGNVAPLALGISLTYSKGRIFALEGDGSLLMNLGTLITLYRYGSNKIRLIIFDNKCYESTGSQPSQPDNFQLENICQAVGLETQIAERPEQIYSFMRASHESHPSVLVAKINCTPPAPRINENPKKISSRFSECLTKLMR